MKHLRKNKILVILILILGLSSLMICYKYQRPKSIDAVRPDKSARIVPLPVFRGNSQLDGYVELLPEKLIPAWTFRAKAMTEAGPVSDGGKIYFGDAEGFFYCLTIQDGKVVWMKKLCDGISASALLVERICYIGGQSGDFFALSMNDGNIIWRYKIDGQINGSANFFRGKNQPGIVFGGYDFKLHCLEPETGRELWHVSTGNYINGTPAVDGNRIIFGGCDGYLRTIDAASGKEKIKLKLQSYIPASPAIYDAITYVAVYEQKIFAVDRANKIIWDYKSDDDATVFISSPAVNRDFVVIAARDGVVYILSRAEGRLQAKFNTSGDIATAPVISGTRGIIADKDGFIYIFDLKEGRELWSYHLGPAVTAPIAVCGDIIIIADNDGNITAFKP